MRVYVESNFILELALGQEEVESCRGILAERDRGAVTLVIPGFALAEPIHALTGRAKTRQRTASDLATQLGELSRNMTYAERVGAVRRVTALLVDSIEAERAGLRSSLQDVLRDALVLPIDRQTVDRAVALEASISLQLPDALMLASVLIHLENDAADSVFLNRNRKDFEDPDVVAMLQAQNCRLIPSFGGGLGYIRSVLR